MTNVTFFLFILLAFLPVNCTIGGMFKLSFTVCFLFRADKILMLLRNKPPNQGLWNGVGGHIEPGETPYESCLREVKEETGFKPVELNFGGILTWEGFEIEEGGLFIFTALAPDGEPQPTTEGKLAWLLRQTVLLSSKVVENIHYFGPAVFSGFPPNRHHFVYNCRTILKYHVFPLPKHVNVFEPLIIKTNIV